MKRVILAAVLIIAFSTVSFAKKLVAEGKTFSALGDYKIELADNPILMKGTDCRAYKISYANTTMDVTIVVCKEKNCRKYVVLSDKLSVQYVCNSSYFGVEKLDKAFEAEGYRTSYAALNRVEYFHQKVLGPGQKGEIEATQLIAAYFPWLFNNYDGITATR
jgi:hypothetical protein